MAVSHSMTVKKKLKLNRNFCSSSLNSGGALLIGGSLFVCHSGMTL